MCGGDYEEGGVDRENGERIEREKREERGERMEREVRGRNAFNIHSFDKGGGMGGFIYMILLKFVFPKRFIVLYFVFFFLFIFSMASFKYKTFSKNFNRKKKLRL